jgi:serine palmitoyltransferase
MLVGSIANGLASCGGFCAGSQIVVDHQRINGTSFVFSASMPALLAVSASEGISILRNQPSILTALQENVRAVHAVLASIVGTLIFIPSHPASPIIHITIKPQSPPLLSPTAIPLSTSTSTSSKSSSTKSNPASIHPSPSSPSFCAAEHTFDADAEEKLLQEIVEECLAQGVWVTRAKRLKGQEMAERKPSIRIAVSAALTRKEVEKAAGVVKGACAKVLGRRR